MSYLGATMSLSDRQMSLSGRQMPNLGRQMSLLVRQMSLSGAYLCPWWEILCFTGAVMAYMAKTMPIRYFLR